MKSLAELKEEFSLLKFIAFSKAPFKWTAFKLSLSVFLYDLRGITRCPYHGYCKQSFWTGYCSECGKIPVLPPIEASCCMCGEEEAVLQRASPNNDKEIWSLCWECDQYIEWGVERSWHLNFTGKETPPFDKWLFEKHQVWPKGESQEFVIKKKE